MAETLQIPVIPVAPVSRADDANHSDAALVTSILRGEKSAYEHLVRRYDRPVRATCFAILKDWHAAQDAAQESFLAAYINLRSLRNPTRFGPWILTIAHRAALHLSRANMAHQPLDHCPDPINARQPFSESSELFELIGQLPKHERAVVILRYIGGHSIVGIAGICGKPVGTITKQLSRAHKRLEKLFAQGERK